MNLERVAAMLVKSDNSEYGNKSRIVVLFLQKIND